MKLKESDYKKITQFFDREMPTSIGNIPIIKKKSESDMTIGGFHLYKQYDKWMVNDIDETIIFETRKNAIYYILMRCYHKNSKAKHLRQLDEKLGIYKSQIHHYHSLLKRTTDHWYFELYYSKMNEAVARYNAIRRELRNWFIFAKYIKLGIIKHET